LRKGGIKELTLSKLNFGTETVKKFREEEERK